ncbi:Fe(3+)-hydroxamate ABC transporter permease FhuB [Ancylobacter sp. Lp-2]|uniref:Fe(3+)-hydroxamate ABC transporter permease FhuB n=1 Tax=Ancylobacter sp. Lp-2 TaxID=2881339 RepID=UPI001E3C0CDA|nr:Fe(3+)-hydroxamate ABC transporter permease FhuB [Ancylobacter sp. Lp-2]MCB4768623.1 Fe(3+)-hydroxamate ABC transporter permease FhuB [Ancylobacter sp. Lp-2]
MADTIADPTPRGFPMLPALVLGGALAAGALSFHHLSAILPVHLWWQALSDPGDNVSMLVFAETAVPRLVVCGLVGALLALAGTLLQSALHNPMADTTTLGTASGAYLALATAEIYAPVLLAHGQQWVALGGAAIAGMLVLAIARGAGFAPVTVILAGLTLNLLCGALGASLAILNHETLTALFVWQSGSLAQNGWGNVTTLTPWLALAAVLGAVIRRPLASLQLGDPHARAVGILPWRVRLVAGGVAISLGAVAVSAVGVIGFIGLAAPHLARLLGARTLGRRMIWASLIGAVLLWLVDEAVQSSGAFRGTMPTGSAAALLGAPLLLWIILRRREATAPHRSFNAPVDWRTHRPRLVIILLVAGVSLCGLLALGFGKGMTGWGFIGWSSAGEILPWRAPRVLAALGAGVLLAIAGALMQRMTGNVMASPEVLGVSSGAALGVIALLFIVPGFDRVTLVPAAFLGAVGSLALVVAFNWRSGFASNRLLLTGMSLATLFNSVAALVLTSGDPRAAALLAWMSGSTYRVTVVDAQIVLLLAVALFAAASLTVRWLDLLPLGGVAHALGLGVTSSRLTLLAIAAAAAGTATLIVGPLSFVGLMAPQMARLAGLQRPLVHLAGSAVIGGGLLVMADWLGRTLLFPWQIPAGLVSAVLGAPLFLLLLWMRR